MNLARVRMWAGAVAGVSLAAGCAGSMPRESMTSDSFWES